MVSPLSLFHLEHRDRLSHGVKVTGVVFRTAMMIIAGVRNLMQMTGDGCTG
jgi:hypothetical protein